MYDEIHFKTLIGFALIVLAFTVPLSYCVQQTEKSNASVKIACLEKGGEWNNSWGGYCKLPEKGK